MSTTTLHDASGNGHASSSVFADTAILLVPIAHNFMGFEPLGPVSLPPDRSISMPRQEANALAVSLNRRLLVDYDGHIPHWHFVVYRANGSGFVVMKLHFPGWQPKDEYSLPPCYLDNLHNGEGRAELKTINTLALRSGEPQQWGILVKPLLPEDSPRLERRNDHSGRQIYLNQSAYELQISGADEDVSLSVFNCRSKEEAIAKAKRFLKSLTDSEAPRV